MTTARESSGPVRAPAFVYREAKSGILRRRRQFVLHCEEVALPKLAERYGTPLYVYSAAMIRERYESFEQAFREVPHVAG